MVLVIQGKPRKTAPILSIIRVQVHKMIESVSYLV